jgi:hypothetical protein
MERTTIIGDTYILDILGGLERAGHSLGRLGDVLVLGWRLAWNLSNWISASAN